MARDIKRMTRVELESELVAERAATRRSNTIIFMMTVLAVLGFMVMGRNGCADHRLRPAARIRSTLADGHALHLPPGRRNLASAAHGCAIRFISQVAKPDKVNCARTLPRRCSLFPWPSSPAATHPECARSRARTDRETGDA